MMGNVSYMVVKGQGRMEVSMYILVYVFILKVVCKKVNCARMVGY